MPKKRKYVLKEEKDDAQAHHKIEDKLLQNLVDLQKVHTHLAEKFDKLSTQISELLLLFESAAKSFAKNPVVKTTENDREFLEKIDKLIEQNKTIAKGLSLMGEKVRGKIYEEPEELSEKLDQEIYTSPIKSSNRPLLRF